MRILMFVSGMDVEPCTPRYCGSCDKKEYPGNITQRFDLCAEGGFY